MDTPESLGWSFLLLRRFARRQSTPTVSHQLKNRPTRGTYARCVAVDLAYRCTANFRASG